MQGLFYLLAIIAVCVVFYWFVRNDHIADGEKTRGLISYKESDSEPPDGGRKKKRAKRKRWVKAGAANKTHFPPP